MRCEGWEKKLSDYLEAQAKTPFVWGENDCVLFAAKAAQEILTGRDIAGEISSYGEYNEQTAADIITQHGGSLAGIFDKHFSRKHKHTVQRGDIAIIDFNGQEAAGVVSGRYVFCKSLSGRLVPINIINILTAWEVE
jgi:hypothetical protein